MASKLKEEEKNEKAIRTLLRNAPNRRCINCNSLVRASAILHLVKDLFLVLAEW